MLFETMMSAILIDLNPTEVASAVHESVRTSTEISNRE